MSVQLLIAIDGTASREFGYSGGVSEDLKICATNESNTRRFHRLAKIPETQKYFDHGPDEHATGWDCGKILDRAWEWLRRKLSGSPQASIFLVGHSRGGHIVTELAIRLADYRVGDFQPMILAPGSPRPRGEVQPVEFLGLFDAVDMTTSLGDTSAVPANVKSCYHARRSPETGSRKAWGNTAIRSDNPSPNAYVEKFFDATHGAIGGAFPEDCEGGIGAKVGAATTAGYVMFGVAGGVVAGLATANVNASCSVPVTAAQNAMLGREAFAFVQEGAKKAGLAFD